MATETIFGVNNMDVCIKIVKWFLHNCKPKNGLVSQSFSSRVWTVISNWMTPMRSKMQSKQTAKLGGWHCQVG